MNKIKAEVKTGIRPNFKTQYLYVHAGDRRVHTVPANDETLKQIADAIYWHFQQQGAEAETVPETGCPDCGSKYYAGMVGPCQCAEEVENG